MSELNVKGNDFVSDRSLEMLMHLEYPQQSMSSSRAEIVMHRFESAMRIGILNQGDRLPPETTLSEFLEVSPLTLRHGLHMLRNKGLVDTRRGRGGGSYISGQIVPHDSDIDDRLRFLESDELRDLFDLAASTAGAAARFAAIRADALEIHSLRTRNKNFENETTGAGLRRADGRFHIGLGIAAQSKRITSLLVRVQADIAPLSWRSDDVAERSHTAHAEHDALIDAIATGDADLAFHLASRHIEAEQFVAIERHLTLQQLEESA